MKPEESRRGEKQHSTGCIRSVLSLTVSDTLTKTAV